MFLRTFIFIPILCRLLSSQFCLRKDAKFVDILNLNLIILWFSYMNKLIKETYSLDFTKVPKTITSTSIIWIYYRCIVTGMNELHTDSFMSNRSSKFLSVIPTKLFIQKHRGYNKLNRWVSYYNPSSFPHFTQKSLHQPNFIRRTHRSIIIIIIVTALA